TGTGAVEARVVGGAGVAIVAGGGVVRVDASGGGRAGIDRTRIAVAAVEGGAADAGPRRAAVVRGADVAVFAGVGVVRVHAPCGGRAGVIRAGIAVAAVGGRSADTDARGAGVVRGAGVSVEAGRGGGGGGRCGGRGGVDDAAGYG